MPDPHTVEWFLQRLAPHVDSIVQIPTHLLVSKLSIEEFEAIEQLLQGKRQVIRDGYARQQPTAIPRIPGMTALGEQTFSVPIEDGSVRSVFVYRHDRFWAALSGLEYLQGAVSHPAAEFVLIPQGEFMMGDPAGELSAHRVEIQKPFLLARTPMTQRVWRGLVGSTGLIKSPSHFNGDRRPVEQVSWNYATAWCAANGLRLPSESEWEYACRAGTTTPYFFGDSEGELGNYAWFRDNSGLHTNDVGGKQTNAFGLHDMYGNVWEWVQDTYESTYVNAPTDGRAWETLGASLRVFRGGSWNSIAWRCRSAIRSRNEPDLRINNLGFRPAMSLPDTLGLGRSQGLRYR